jgi:hypothetical protein
VSPLPYHHLPQERERRRNKQIQINSAHLSSQIAIPVIFLLLKQFNSKAEPNRVKRAAHGEFVSLSKLRRMSTHGDNPMWVSRPSRVRKMFM